jgi:hypothetical protein
MRASTAMSTTVAKGLPHLSDEMWGTRCRADKDIAGTQSLVSAVAISGIIEIQPIPTSNEADMSS